GFFAVQRVVLGEITDQRAGQHGHVVGGGDLAFVRPAGGVDEVGVFHSQRLRLLVHHFGEGVFTASDVLGQRHGGVVAGLDHQATQQVFDVDLRAFADEHFRAAHAPGVDADGDLVVQRQVLLVQLTGNDVVGH